MWYGSRKLMMATSNGCREPGPGEVGQILFDSVMHGRIIATPPHSALFASKHTRSRKRKLSST